MRARRFMCVLLSAVTIVWIVGDTRSALAYLKFGHDLNGEPVALRWNTTPIRYYVSNYDIPNVTAPAFASAVARAFQTWEDVPLSTVSYRFGGYTGALPGQDDGVSTVGFLNEPMLDRVLATTSYLIDGETGQVIESDIFFNSAFAWSAAESGVANRWDVQTIALHEIGHFNGLGHSAIGETTNSPGGRRVLSSATVMFPIALGPGDISGRTLEADDIAGISDLYPADDFATMTGSVSGRVTKNGRGVFGVHVVAFDPSTGSQVANFTLNGDGQFSIAGLRPGPQLLRVEPLDDADLESFFGAGQPVDIALTPRFFEKLVVVPRGGDSGAVVIPVDRR